MHGAICVDDPRAADVRDLLAQHLAFTSENSPPRDRHALDVDGLVDPDVTFYSYRLDGRLLGVGALKRLDDTHAEVKSMHTLAVERRHGIGSKMLDHLICEARIGGYRRLSLETGTMEAFSPARSLYERTGFTKCAPFGAYVASPNSTFMTMRL